LVALIGANGSGKTTLVSLLPRLFDPCAGRIEIDGVDISQVNLNDLRAQIALVPQEGRLFQGSVAQNIAYGLANVSPARIVAAARAARADEFIVDLPRGYDKELGEFGSGLSGGQKQRIAIARALLRDPAILILDEATSDVDPDSERKIQGALAGLRGERTIFLITQRWNSLAAADLIILMHSGEIIDSGTHEQLLQRCPLYSGLAYAQPASNLHVTV
jgi:ABC-type multidrug transport system fused ATPase/permease subunit